MHFGPDSWVVTVHEGASELVYVRSMVQVYNSGKDATTAEYVEIFRFAFAQLQVKKQANTLRVNTARFQAVLNAAACSDERMS